MMARAATVEKSLVEQIVEEMLASLAERDEFDSEAIQRLERLVVDGNLNKAKLVAESITPAPGRRP